LLRIALLDYLKEKKLIEPAAELVRFKVVETTREPIAGFLVWELVVDQAKEAGHEGN